MLFEARQSPNNGLFISHEVKCKVNGFDSNLIDKKCNIICNETSVKTLCEVYL